MRRGPGLAAGSDLESVGGARSQPGTANTWGSGTLTYQRLTYPVKVKGLSTDGRPDFVVTGIAVVANDALGLRKRRVLGEAVTGSFRRDIPRPVRNVAPAGGTPGCISRKTMEQPLAGCLLSMGRERTGT